VIQAQRSRARSLMAPLAICSVLLILTCFAIWTGMYQYQAAEAAQTDVAALATADTTNHFVVVLLWFRSGHVRGSSRYMVSTLAH